MRTIVVIALLCLLYGAGLFWGLPSEFTSAVDAPVPYSPLAFVAQYSNANAAQRYPAAHQLLLLCFYAPVLAALKLVGQWPSAAPHWPYGFRDPVKALSSLILVSNVVSMGMAVGLLLAVRHVDFTGFRRIGRWIAVLLLAFSGVFTYYARVGNLDIPYVFWWFLSFVFLWRYLFRDGDTTKWLYVAAPLSAIAIATKDQAAGLVLGSGLLIFLVGPASGPGWRKKTEDAARFGCLTVLIYCAVAVLPQPFRWIQHVKIWTPSALSIALEGVQFDNNLSGQAHLALATLRCLSHIVSLPGMILSAMGLLQLARLRQYRVLCTLVLPAVCYYLAIFAPIRLLHERYLLPVSVPVAILAGVGATFLLEHDSAKYGYVRWAALSAVGVCVGYQVVSGYFPITYIQVLDSKRQLARTLPSYVPEGSQVLYYGGLTSLPTAATYTKYQLVLPSNARTPGDQSARHLFHSYSGRAKYLLSNAPLRSSGGGWELTAAWLYPNWVRAAVHDVPCIKEYYLYTLKGNGVVGVADIAKSGVGALENLE